MNIVVKALIAPLALAALPLVSAQAQSLSPEQQELAAENFMQADANADGALDPNEFRRLIDLNAEDSLGRARMIQRFGKYDRAFNRVDINKDGFATPEEMKATADAARS